MKYKWVNYCNNSEVIVFFNGWGMDDSVIKHLEPENYDVLMLYDYNNLECEFNFENLNSYTKRHLVAWSMGVMTATLFDINWDSKTAVNGTLKPIDDSYGIPKRIYDLTLKNFSPLGAKKFIKNMLDENCEIPKIARDFENQQSELFALKNYNADLNFNYTKIFISSNDKIIPTKNQISFWKMEANINSSHMPFMLFKKWKELI